MHRYRRYISMRLLFLLVGLTFFVNKSHSTGQIPDLLLYEKDTLDLFNNPLTQYFEKFGKRDIPGVKNDCHSSACWRGYQATWLLQNDSLFLVRITSCCNYPDGPTEGDLKAMFGKKIVFASWYNGTLRIPRGEIWDYADMGYNATYEYEERLHIESGKLIGKDIHSNVDWIQYQIMEKKLNEKIQDLSDTLKYYISKNINWEKLDDTYFMCDDFYLLEYSRDGKLSHVELGTNYIDSNSTLGDKIFEYRANSKCSRQIRKAIKELTLHFIDSHRDFIIRLELFYYKGELEVWECELNYRIPSDEEIEEYVRNQVNIME